MSDEVVNEEVVAEPEAPAAEEVIVEDGAKSGSSDIDYMAEIKAEVAKAIAERDEALAELDRVKSGSGISEEAQKHQEELKALLASFKGKGGQVPTGAAAPASNNNQGATPESASARTQRLLGLFN